MIKTRKSHHSSIKIAVNLGLEKIILPKEFLDSIAPSTLHGWKHNFNPKKLCGSQYAKLIDNNLSDANTFLELSNKNTRTFILSMLYFRRFLIQNISKNGFQKLLRDNKAKTIKFVEWLDEKTTIGKAKISQSIGIGRKTLSNWKRQIKFICHTSAFGKCMVDNPNQATADEMETMKTLLADPDKAHWGIPSIQGWAIREKVCFMSKTSWYKYNRIFKIRKSISKFKKTDYKPLRASFVNEIWHADITVFTTLDGVKNYIYTIIDNFSRKTIVKLVESKVSAQIRLSTIRDALKFAFPNDSQCVRLITDGGPENDNLTLKEFMINNQALINHQIALKDIVQSIPIAIGTMVEASYRCFKSHFLYGKQIHNTKDLIKYVDFYYDDHDRVKPHSAHIIYTPDEVYFGNNPDFDLKQIYKNTAIKRRITNKKGKCGVC